jgi:hypothetical protein
VMIEGLSQNGVRNYFVPGSSRSDVAKQISD